MNMPEKVVIYSNEYKKHYNIEIKSMETKNSLSIKESEKEEYFQTIVIEKNITEEDFLDLVKSCINNYENCSIKEYYSI